MICVLRELNRCVRIKSLWEVYEEYAVGGPGTEGIEE